MPFMLFEHIFEHKCLFLGARSINRTCGDGM